MPTNEQRRQAAKRKLERQLERRAAQAKRRRQLIIAFSAIGVVLAVGVVALVVVLNRGNGNDAAAASSPTTATTPPSDLLPAGAPMPSARKTPLPPTVDCTYPATSGQPAAKPNTAPPATGVSTEGTVDVTMDTTQGAIGLTLNKALAPCTVNSFVSLTKQGFFDNTPCPRLVSSGIFVLQCGDPTGKGTGGPGYGFANEFPTDQYATDPAVKQTPATYPRGTIAMAHSAQPNSNGSQFFLLYKDSPLPPDYTIFGTIDEPGLAVIEKVAAGGDDGSNQAGGGAPKIAVTITSMKVKA